MAPPEIIRTAKQYVAQQIETMGDRVPKKDAAEAARKVAKALDEFRQARIKSETVSR